MYNETEFTFNFVTGEERKKKPILLFTIDISSLPFCCIFWWKQPKNNLWGKEAQGLCYQCFKSSLKEIDCLIGPYLQHRFDLEYLAEFVDAKVFSKQKKAFC